MFEKLNAQNLPFYISKQAVCKNSTAFGFTQKAKTNAYYAIADKQMPWEAGELFCQSFGAHLPTPQSADDVIFLRCKFCS